MPHQLKIIHLTDLHLIEPGEKLFGLSPHACVDRCLEDIVKWHSDADFCIITGDLTHVGQPEAYAWLRDRLSAYPLTTHLMIGNHDDPSAFKAHFPETPVDQHGFIQHAFDTPAGRMVLLDTYKGATSEGSYCERRRNWLRTQLDAAKGEPAWLFMHHPPFDISNKYMDRIKLEDHAAFGDLITAYDNIRHIFYGHIHRPGYVNWRGIPFTSLPSLNHQVPLSRGAVDGKPYSYEPPMYGVVLIDEDQVTIHFDAFDNRQTPDM